MALEIRTSEPAIRIVTEPERLYMAWEKIQLRMTHEEYRRFNEIYQAGHWKTKTSCLVDLISAGMNKIEDNFKKNHRLPEEDE